MDKVELEALFNAIIKRPILHGRFLNTLSLIEFQGAQKISRIINKSNSSLFLLEHLSEEYRHAYYLRKLAQKISKTVIKNYVGDNILAAPYAPYYLSKLDKYACVLLRRQGVEKIENLKSYAYYLCTYIIEIRALNFYNSYQIKLEKCNLGINLKSIISEEKKHLVELESRCIENKYCAKSVDELQSFETLFFNNFISCIKKEISD